MPVNDSSLLPNALMVIFDFWVRDSAWAGDDQTENKIKSDNKQDSFIFIACVSTELVLRLKGRDKLVELCQTYRELGTGKLSLKMMSKCTGDLQFEDVAT